ncbi:hypothetical protein MNBD_GAMMA05-1781 [hydrothermal vent metagenome]|uniref:DUF4124 domain-containing protein n=1 Tax=hydrothermal vent metagenome TaxID=652676 RepID=A0A3B0XFP4_9ZZZZ
MRFPLLIITTILLSSSFAVQAKMYKWVDEDGQMHFGDKIPVKYQVKAHDEINESGAVVKHRKAEKTIEEKAVAARAERERKRLALIEKKKRQRDRVLLDTYTTERDLFVARDSRLDAVGSQIQLAESIIKDSNNKIESMEKQVVSIEKSNRKVPDSLYKRIENERHQVEIQSRVMEKNIARRDEITEQFNGYIVRFKELKAEQKAKRERIARERGL